MLLGESSRGGKAQGARGAVRRCACWVTRRGDVRVEMIDSSTKTSEHARTNKTSLGTLKSSVERMHECCL